MLRRFNFILLFICIVAVIPASGQLSNLHSKKIATSGTIQVDTLSIVPGSFNISGIDSGFYWLDWINGVLTWKKSAGTDSILISYRSFPLRLNKVNSRFDYDSIRNNFIAAPAYYNRINKNDNNLLNFGKLNYNGSFGRSLSVGNNQDAVFNSQLNLQLSGYIGDSIELTAAITDNNIPIQPDGTTQQLNEFDKILLEFKKKNWVIDLGDIDLRQNQAYFLNFYKRLQGLSFQQKIKLSPQIKSDLLFAGAIAKGKFARNVFQGLEGNQGPYRLQGNNNELFFIVLSGTEKVFIDGVKLVRGEDQDYTINYNTAEISFTPKQMISKDKRIQVEFEYADRNFLNSMLYVSTQTDIGNKFSLNIAAYSNVDAKNSAINQTLDIPQKQFLSGIGDDVQNALYPSASLDSFDINKVLYKKIDTVYDNNLHDSVYIYSTNPDSARFSLSFTETGLNKGNYIPLFNGANGKVFQWIQPVNGIPQGNYEPAILLITPKKQQVAIVGASYRIDAATVIKAEIAYSNYDINSFSQKDKSNDKGYASKINVDHNTIWRKRDSSLLRLNINSTYEWVDKNFRPVERLRAVEFSRDWGLPVLTMAATEKLPSLSLLLSDERNNSLQYRFTSYLRSDGFKGLRNELIQNQIIGGIIMNNAFSLTQSTTPLDKGFYLRPTINLSKTLADFNNYVIGASYALEHNENRNVLTDTVTPLSFAFETISAFIKSNPSGYNKWAFTYYTRSDKLPYRKELIKTDRSNNFNFQTELLQNRHHQVRLSATYRRLFVTNNLLTAQLPDNSLLGRAEYAINEWNGFIVGNILYELGAGQEQRRDFSYIEVPAGTGIYAWNDYNLDGIPQLNEFEQALFPDQAKYIRIYTPTNEYIKAGYTQFNYSFIITPKALMKTRQQQKSFISKLMLQSALQTFKKEISNGNPVFNPIKGSLVDTALINLNYLINNTLSFNRYSSSWGIDAANLISYNKALLTYGFETGKRKEYSLKGRVNIAKAFSIELLQQISNVSLNTPNFENRNYAIKGYEARPKFTYINATKYRLQTVYSFIQKTNEAAYGNEKAIINSIEIEGKYNTISNTGLTANLTYSNINFKGNSNTTVSYIMLDGLLPGKNFLWGISLTKRLVNNLEISIDYKGRKPGEGRTIHSGTAGLRALL